MQRTTHTIPEFELPNVGVGPDPLSLADIVTASDFAVLLFLRDYHCPKCKQQVAAVTREASQFNERNAVVLPILPEPRGRATAWKENFDGTFPFPLLADAEKRVADAYEQPTRFGSLGSLHDLLGRLPQSLVIDTRGDEPDVVFSHRGDGVDDRPTVEQLLSAVEDVRESFVFDCSLVDC